MSTPDQLDPIAQIDLAEQLTAPQKRKVVYTGPVATGISLKVTLTPKAPSDDLFPFNQGVAMRHGKKSATVLLWSDLVNQLRYLLQHSPEARADVAAMVKELGE